MKTGVGRPPCQILATTTGVLKPSVLGLKNLNPLYGTRIWRRLIVLLSRSRGWRPSPKQNESEKLCIEIQRNSSKRYTRCLVTADSLEIGSLHETFDEVRSMNSVRGKSHLFVIPNQKTLLIICTKFYSAKSIHDPFRQNVLSVVLRDLQTTPPSFT
jgi:hypothetical protein